MKTRVFPAFLAASLFGLSPLLSLAQPFNPFNVQRPINTSGPNGQSYEIGNVSPRFHTGNSASKSPRFPQTYMPIGSDQTLALIYQSGAETMTDEPPQEAGPFIREPFYPHLTSLILRDRLPRNVQKRLQDYQATRDRAAATVVRKLTELKTLSPDEAATAWVAFETKERATWEQIESERTELMERLQYGGWWAPGVGLDDVQELLWWSGADQETTPLIDLGIIRHFTPGLSLDQRDLIGELQIELNEPDSGDQRQRTVLISGSGDCIELPETMTPAQKKALQAFTQTKAELKQEIITTLLPLVHDAFNQSRLERTAYRLNDIQAPKFERMARELDHLTWSLGQPAKNSPSNIARLVGPDTQIDLEAFAILSGSQRRLLAYSSVTR